MDLTFYKDKKVFVTGSTGFKGSWLCKILLFLGADVTGYALKPNTTPALFDLLDLDSKMKNVIGDIRDFGELNKVYTETQPDVVFHLAAQPIVREGYENPKYTYETNVMGTVNLFECIRQDADRYISCVNVTTDKVYKNNEWTWGYRENEELNGYDPYSNSKSCSELVTSSYINSFFNERNIPISTARAGNVIGGGDFAEHRIIPDCIRAMEAKEEIIIRNPNSVRPYQHVLESLFGYLMLAMAQYKDASLAGSYNIGPENCDCVTTGNLADIFCDKWGESAAWTSKNMGGPHEANFLKLDCSKVKSTFGWQPVWNVEKAIEKTIEFSKVYLDNGDLNKIVEQQVEEYEQDFSKSKYSC